MDAVAGYAVTMFSDGSSNSNSIVAGFIEPSLGLAIPASTVLAYTEETVVSAKESPSACAGIVDDFTEVSITSEVRASVFIVDSLEGSHHMRRSPYEATTGDDAYRRSSYYGQEPAVA